MILYFPQEMIVSKQPSTNHPSFHSSIHTASTHLYLHSFIWPDIHPSFHPSIHLSIHPFTSSGTALMLVKPFLKQTKTLLAPHRSADVAQSNAVSPAPKTITTPLRLGREEQHLCIPTKLKGKRVTVCVFTCLNRLFPIENGQLCLFRVKCCFERTKEYS